MIRVRRHFKPLLDQLSSVTRRPQTARRLILFFAAAILGVAIMVLAIIGNNGATHLLIGQ